MNLRLIRFTADKGFSDGVRVNQGIAEKLYAFVQGFALFLSAYVVALAVQWKLALITMSIVPAMVLCIGGAVALDAPIEARIVSETTARSRGAANVHVPLFRHVSILAQQFSLRMLSAQSRLFTRSEHSRRL